MSDWHEAPLSQPGSRSGKQGLSFPAPIGEDVLLSYSEALDRILADLTALGIERVSLQDALGRVVGADILARRSLPPEDNSAMDGYALRCADQAAPLRVCQLIPAGGRPQREVLPGEAARIFTGAPVPPGADTVVAQERTERGGDLVRIVSPESVGANVRPRGEDVAAGDRIAARGDVVIASQIGMLASQGMTWVDVARRPVVAILATGDEVHEPGDPLPEGHIWSGNSHALAAAVREAGGEPRMLGIARDDTESLRRALDGIRNADVLLTIGGVSVGEFDFVKEAIDALGGQQDFWKVRVRPGKPNAFGRIGGTSWFGLPGNPVSCMVSFYEYVRPAMLTLLGRRAVFLPTRTAVLEHDLRKRKGFLILFRGVLSYDATRGYTVRTTGPQGSGLMSSMANADCLIAGPEDAELLTAGSGVTVQLLPGGPALHAQPSPGIGGR